MLIEDLAFAQAILLSGCFGDSKRQRSKAFGLQFADQDGRTKIHFELHPDRAKHSASHLDLVEADDARRAYFGLVVALAGDLGGEGLVGEAARVAGVAGRVRRMLPKNRQRDRVIQNLIVTD